MSQIKVNSIIPVGGLPSGANGGIIQSVQTVKTDVFSSTSGHTFTDVTGLTVTITPSSNSSKVLIVPSIQLSAVAGSRHGYRLLRGSTAIGIADAADNRVQFTQQTAGYSNAVISTHAFLFIDSPATTSATTYKIQVRGEPDSSSYPIYINRTHDDSNNDTYGRSISSITAFEITT
jgi:hypothetical protein